MRRFKSLILVLIFALASCQFHNASAQSSVLPDIEIDCITESYSGVIQIDVYPGATNTALLSCTLYNPTLYPEDVEVTIDSGFFLAIGPGTVTVGPGAEEYFVVTLRAESETLVQSIIVETKAVVVAVSGQDVGALPEITPESEFFKLYDLQNYEVAASKCIEVLSKSEFTNNLLGEHRAKLVDKYDSSKRSIEYWNILQKQVE